MWFWWELCFYKQNYYADSFLRNFTFCAKATAAESILKTAFVPPHAKIFFRRTRNSMPYYASTTKYFDESDKNWINEWIEKKY